MAAEVTWAALCSSSSSCATGASLLWHLSGREDGQLRHVDLHHSFGHCVPIAVILDILKLCQHDEKSGDAAVAAHNDPEPPGAKIIPLTDVPRGHVHHQPYADLFLGVVKWHANDLESSREFKGCVM